jgi:hypothetical protein
MRSATREKEVHNPLHTEEFRTELKGCIEALEDYAASPWFKKGFTRART